MADRIDLRGLGVFARHGVYASELAEGQQFVVDLSVVTDLSKPGLTDELSDTIDYGALAMAVRHVVAVERWNLIERVATRVAEVALAFDERVESVVVTVHKPQAPIPADFDDVAVTIERSR